QPWCKGAGVNFSPRPKRWPAVVIGLCLLFLFGPIVLIALLSFNDSGVASLPIRGVTLHWYDALWADERFREAGIFSLKVAFVSTAIAVCIGTAGALGIGRRHPTRVGSLLGYLWTAPLLIPALVLAIAL